MLTGDPGTRAVTSLAVLWLLGVTVADVLAPSTVVPNVLYAIAPLIACAVLSPQATALFGLAATVLLVASGWWSDTWDTAQQWIRLLDVVLVSGAAILIALVRRQRERRTTRLAAIAETAQRVILPAMPTTIDGLNTATRYLSAAEDAVVGGDLFDWSFTRGHTRFIVGDVRGKGLPAVEQAARTIRAFRQAAAAADTLADAAREIDSYLIPFLREDEFVTAVLIETSSPDAVTVVSCGHPPPLLVRRDGSAQFLECRPGLPLGLSVLLPAPSEGAKEEAFAWTPGDRLLLYTDGLSEARNSHREFLSLLDLAPVLLDGSVETALDELLIRVRRHVQDSALSDDVAVVLIERPLAAGGATRGG